MGNNANSSTTVSYDDLKLLQAKLKELFALSPHGASLSFTVDEEEPTISSMLDVVEKNNTEMLELLHA